MKKKTEKQTEQNLTKTWIYAIELRLKFCRKYCHIMLKFTAIFSVVFSEFVQRIFTYGDIQNNKLTLEKETSVLI